MTYRIALFLTCLSSFAAQAGETVITCPATVDYSVALQPPSMEWQVETEAKFIANFSDLQLFDATAGAKELTPENGDAPAEKNLPLTWKLVNAKKPRVECHFKASDGAPGMGATLIRALPEKTQTCTSQPIAGSSGRELRCTTL